MGSDRFDNRHALARVELLAHFVLVLLGEQLDDLGERGRYCCCWLRCGSIAGRLGRCLRGQPADLAVSADS